MSAPAGNPEYTIEREYVKLWFKDPEHTTLHRVDGPAVERINGTTEWWFDGKTHRVGGPAVTDAFTGDEIWYRYGLMHRVGGPATVKFIGVTDDSGNHKWVHYHSIWLQHGERHRLNGPALERSFDNDEWYLFGKATNEQIVHQFRSLIFSTFNQEDIEQIPYEVLKELFINSGFLDKEASQ